MNDYEAPMTVVLPDSGEHGRIFRASWKFRTQDNLGANLARGCSPDS